MKTKFTLLIALFAIILISACSKNSNPVNNGETETTPSITSLSADKPKILYGGEDKATITCQASGGNLSYVWKVDLGDIIPENSSHSMVSYTGAACCVGEKTITCTVSNSKGSVSKDIIITILEVIKVPEIISINTDKTDLSYGTNDKANIVCYAIGGNLKYAWEADCGSIAVDQTDNSKIVYTPNANCLGTKTIKCTVTNEKGTVSGTVQINVK